MRERIETMVLTWLWMAGILYLAQQMGCTP